MAVPASWRHHLVAISSHHFWDIVFDWFCCFLNPSQVPFWMIFLVLFINNIFEHVLSLLCFLISMVFRILNLQNATSYRRQTSSYLKSPFLKQIAKSIIPVSFFASFCQHFPCYSMICFWIFFCFLFKLISVPKWLPTAGAADTILASFFDIISTLFRKGVFEGFLARFDFGFGFLLATFQLSGT